MPDFLQAEGVTTMSQPADMRKYSQSLQDINAIVEVILAIIRVLILMEDFRKTSDNPKPFAWEGEKFTSQLRVAYQLQPELVEGVHVLQITVSYIGIPKPSPGQMDVLEQLQRILEILQSLGHVIVSSWGIEENRLVINGELPIG